MNKETLEEAAKKYCEKVWGGYKDDVFKHDDIITDSTLSEISKTDFIAGAKWQKERTENEIMVKKYMSRPHFSEAIQLTKDNLKEVLDFIGEHVDWPHCKSGGVDPKNGKLKFHRFGGGDVTASVGDYIMRIKSNETRALLHVDYVLTEKHIFEKQYVVDIEV